MLGLYSNHKIETLLLDVLRYESTEFLNRLELDLSVGSMCV